MSWETAYLATCIVLDDLGAGAALGESLEAIKQELGVDSGSKQVRAHRVAQTLQSTARALERMERRWG